MSHNRVANNSGGASCRGHSLLKDSTQRQGKGAALIWGGGAWGRGEEERGGQGRGRSDTLMAKPLSTKTSRSFCTCWGTCAAWEGVKGWGVPGNVSSCTAKHNQLPLVKLSDHQGLRPRMKHYKVELHCQSVMPSCPCCDHNCQGVQFSEHAKLLICRQGTVCMLGCCIRQSLVSQAEPVYGNRVDHSH